MYNLFDTDRNVPVPLDPLTGYAVRKELFDSPPLFSYYSERILIDILDDYLMEKHKKYQREIADYIIRVNKYDCNFSVKDRNEISYPYSATVDFDIDIRISSEIESYLFLFNLNLIKTRILAKDHPVLQGHIVNNDLLDYYDAVPIKIEIGNLSLISINEKQPIDYFANAYTLIFRNDKKLVLVHNSPPAILFNENKFTSSLYAINLYSRKTSRKIYNEIPISSYAIAPYYFYPINVNFIVLDPNTTQKNIKISTLVPVEISRLYSFDSLYEIRTPVFAEIWIRRKGDIDDLYKNTSLIYNAFQRLYGWDDRNTVGFIPYISDSSFRKVKQDAENLYLQLGLDEKRPLPCYRGIGEYSFDYYQTSVHSYGVSPAIYTIPHLFIKQKSESLFSFIEKQPTPFSFRYEILQNIIRHNLLRLPMDEEWPYFPLKIADYNEGRKRNIDFYDFTVFAAFYEILRKNYPSFTSSSEINNIEEGHRYFIVRAKPNYIIVRSQHKDRIYIYDPATCLYWYQKENPEEPSPADSDKWIYTATVDYRKDFKEILCDTQDQKSILYYLEGAIKVDIEYQLNLHAKITLGSIEKSNYRTPWRCFNGYDYSISTFIGFDVDNYIVGHYTEYVTQGLVYKNKYLIIGSFPNTYRLYTNNVRIFKLGETYNVGNMSLTHSITNERNVIIYSKIVENGYVINEEESYYGLPTILYTTKEQQGPSGGILLLPEYGEQFYDALTEIADSLPSSCTIEDYVVEYLLVEITDIYDLYPYVQYKNPKLTYLDPSIIYGHPYLIINVHGTNPYTILVNTRSSYKVYRYYLFKVKRRITTILNYDNDTVFVSFHPKDKTIKSFITRQFKGKSPKWIYNMTMTKTVEGIIKATAGELPYDYKKFDAENTEIELVWSKTFVSKPDTLESMIEMVREEFEITDAAYLNLYKTERHGYYWLPKSAVYNYTSAVFDSGKLGQQEVSEKPVLNLNFNSSNESSRTAYYKIPFSSCGMKTDFIVSQDGYSITNQEYSYPQTESYHRFVTLQFYVDEYDANVKYVTFNTVYHSIKDDTRKDTDDMFLNIELHTYDKYGNLVSIENEASFYDIVFSRTVRFQ